jgi:hypothetical protein
MILVKADQPCLGVGRHTTMHLGQNRPGPTNWANQLRLAADARVRGVPPWRWAVVADQIQLADSEAGGGGG